MSRESSDGFVCPKCDTVIYRDTCACSFETQLFRTMRTKRFWLHVAIGMLVAIVIVCGMLAL